MKKLLFLSIFLVISVLCNAQTERFQTESWTIRELNDTTGQFLDWKPWKLTDIIILYTPNKSIHVFSELDQNFLIIGISEHVLFKGGEIYMFDAIDDENIRCTIELVDFPSDVYHLYIRWLNLQVVYQMRKL